MGHPTLYWVARPHLPQRLCDEYDCVYEEGGGRAVIHDFVRQGELDRADDDVPDAADEGVPVSQATTAPAASQV